MSLFGSTSGFGTGGTSMFGSTTTDNHNPMKHDAPVKTIHWIKAPNYSCVMTGSWDKTLKFWDTRSSNPMMVLQLPERCYCADVIYPMAVVATAERGLIVYQLENQPSEFRRIESPLKHQVNGIAFHPVHGTLATGGSDGRFSFWDKDARTKLKTSEQLDQPIAACCFNHNGNIFAYASSYDWSKPCSPYGFSIRLNLCCPLLPHVSHSIPLHCFLTAIGRVYMPACSAPSQLRLPVCTCVLTVAWPEC